LITYFAALLTVVNRLYNNELAGIDLGQGIQKKNDKNGTANSGILWTAFSILPDPTGRVFRFHQFLVV
jgi:hypothetical protein